MGYGKSKSNFEMRNPSNADYYRDVFGFRISPKNIRLDYYRGINSEKPEFIENIDSEMAFPNRYFACFGIREFGFVPVRKNKKAAVRRKIQFLVPSSDEDRGPDFPNRPGSCTRLPESTDFL